MEGVVGTVALILSFGLGTLLGLGIKYCTGKREKVKK